MKKIVLTFLLSSMLTACGFHLRGYEPLPVILQTLYVATPDAYSQFAAALQHTLRANGVHLVSNAGEANTLQIVSNKLDQQVTSVGSGGQNTVYLLTYSVQYQLYDAKGQMIQALRTISTTRNYSAGSNQILADTYVKQDLLVDMQRDVIYQMLNQLRLQLNTSHTAIS